jgi:hypothetical protein
MTRIALTGGSKIALKGVLKNCSLIAKVRFAAPPDFN